ncbi:MarR family winged helix-turn-helix transcriptional regulator [Nocardioides mesophilus]|uniref:MarR family transcriptional regulator n=1 Tax=Nocardioides mesophilus TaxID=433659 RepID=A0A7G9RD40_9ACTN|nr:MarR family transcriptional regulator [Nocardioides mesophilus]QNN53515.1 MarR family transcriptional regulator [Nocardioides mesophilus]
MPQLDRDLESLSSDLVIAAGRLVRALSRRTGADVPAATLRLMAQVDELGPVTVGALAAADRCSQPTASAAVQALVDRGWAVKRPNPADARSTLVELTDEGAAALAGTRRRNGEIVAARLRRHPEVDLEALASAVALFDHLLQDTEPEGNL